MLLALDTSTAYVSVCVASRGEVLASRDDVGPMRHGEMLTPSIEAVLADAGIGRHDLTEVVVGVGPGPYTGLRVGVVTARVLGLALGVPVHGVCSLDALALAAVAAGVTGPFLATSDARRRELFWASYDGEGRRGDGPHVDRPEHLPSGTVVGAAPALRPDLFRSGGGPERARAADLVRGHASGRVRHLPPDPVYLRRPDVMAPQPRKRVS